MLSRRWIGRLEGTRKSARILIVPANRVLGVQAMFVAAAGVGIVGIGTAHAQACDPIEIAQFLANDSATDDHFGWSVSVDGDTAVVGAISDDDNGVNSGSAYVFTRSNGTWTQQAKLLPFDGVARDYFGYAVSIEGDTALIGATGDDDYGESSGSAYVYTRAGGVWTLQAKLRPTDGAERDEFGSSVALDGEVALIGSPLDDGNGRDNSGSAYVFARSGNAWTQQAKLLPSDGHSFGGDFFGHSVSIVGSTAVIGARGDDSAEVFTQSGGLWALQAKLTPADEALFFGSSVSLSPDGNTVLIGAERDDDNGTWSGSAYVFTRSADTWTQQAKLLADDGAEEDFFGRTVSLGTGTAVIGAFWDDDNGSKSGSAYVFIRTGSLWTEHAKLLPSGGSVNDAFGVCVSVSDDTAVIGAYIDELTIDDTGAVYVFDIDRSCPADLTGDCRVDTIDFLTFLGAWSVRDPLADWNDDGDINTLDFLAYFADWTSGCS
ncbi:MAG: GC-type dockerin domain-anchored protein [Phycisphaerales bacterium JB054]